MGFKLFRFYVKNEINSRWKFSCSPVFLDFLWKAPHHYSNAVSLSFQPLSSWINICASSQYSGLNLFFFLLFLRSGRYSQNPEGQLGNAAIWKITAPLRHALCALLKSVVIILAGAWWTGERAPNYTGAPFKCGGCCLRPSVPLTYLQLLVDTPADTQPLCRRNDRRSRGFYIPGSIPSLMKLHRQNTGAPDRTVQIETFVSVQMPGSQDNDASQGFPHSSPTYWQPSLSSCCLEPVFVHFVIVAGRWRNSWPCTVLVGKKCLRLKKRGRIRRAGAHLTSGVTCAGGWWAACCWRSPGTLLVRHLCE